MDDDFGDRLYARFERQLSALTLGTLTKAERKALHDELFRTRDGRRLWAMFHPFSVRTRARIFARVEEALRRG